MAAAAYDEGMAVVDLRARIVAFRGKLGERARHIETRKRLGAFLDVGALRDHAGGQPLENLQLQSERALGGAGDLRFEFAQFGGGEADLAGERLAVDEGALSGAAISRSPCWAVTSTK